MNRSVLVLSIVIGCVAGAPSSALAEAPPAAPSAAAPNAAPPSRATVLARGQGNAQHLAVAGGSVYWAIPAHTETMGWANASGAARVRINSKDDGEIRSVSTSGGAPRAVVDKQSNITGLAVDDVGLYWSGDSGCGGFQCLSAGWVRDKRRDSGVETETALTWEGDTQMAPRQAASLVAVGSDLFVDAGGETIVVPKAGGAVSVASAASSVGKGSASLGSVAVDATHVYSFTSRSCVKGKCKSDAKLVRTPLGGGSDEVLASDLAEVKDLAVDATRVFAVVGDRIVSWPKAGGATASEIVKQPGVREVAVDDAAVYFLVEDRVMKVAK
jgi:hypothetical protein